MANIRTARRSGLVLRGGRMRRESLWLGSAPATNSIGLGTGVLLTVLNTAALAFRPFTIIRTRGLLYLFSDQSANSENQMIGFGATVVTEEASAIGVTAVPTPLSEQSSDWYVYETLMSTVVVSSAIGIFNAAESRVIDSKAMRKVDTGQDVITAVETAATGISEGVSFRAQVRTLIKLH